MPRKPLAYVSAPALVTFFLAACGGDVSGTGEEVEPTTVDEQTEQGTATQDEQDTATEEPTAAPEDHLLPADH